MIADPLALTPDVHLVRCDGPTHDGTVGPTGSLVLTDDEPVLVDTGAALDRDRWWAQVETLVDPAEVRWIFLTHEDADHSGNLDEALRRCPDAVLVGSELLRRRLAIVDRLPATRVRWVADGERFDLGGRPMVALRPPAFDSPATLGLCDLTTATFWAADCFGTPVPHPVDDVAQLDPDVWEQGFVEHHVTVSPWLVDLDPVRWRAAVGRVARLDPDRVASAHGPVVHRRDLHRALDLLSELPSVVRSSARMLHLPQR